MWFVGKGESFTGPFSKDDLLKLVKSGAILWVDFVWQQNSMHGWKRLCEVVELREHVPAPPSDKVIQKIKNSNGDQLQADLAGRGKGAWFLQYQGSQFGPLTSDEVKALADGGKLKGEVLVRKDGLKEWLKYDEVKHLIGLSNRKHERVPFFATVKIKDLTGKTDIGIGICRDLSMDGMLIMSSKSPGPLGTEILLDFMPIGAGLTPFSITAEVMRVLPRKDGFAVRFIDPEGNAEHIKALIAGAALTIK